MGLMLIEQHAGRGGSPRARRIARLSPWQVIANWLVIVGGALGAAYVFAGSAGWL